MQVESGLIHDLRLAKNCKPCPWRNNYPCHVKDDQGLDPFKQCLICTLNEILRELEWRRERGG